MQDIGETLAALAEELGSESARISEQQAAFQALSDSLSALEENVSVEDDASGRLLAEARERLMQLEAQCVVSRGMAVKRCMQKVAEGRELLDRVTSLAALGELSASVAHEIRNPLCGMLLLLEVLETKMDPDDSRCALLGNLHREVEKMSKVVNNLLHFARNYEPRVRPCALTEVVRKSVDAVRSHLSKKSIEVEVGSADALPDAHIDGDLVSQVFKNLLLNAVDASPEGGRLQVEFEAGGDGTVAVSFRDCGHGIPPEMQARVFEPFYTSKQKGVGLGLSVSKKIVDAHGGRIELESRPDQGCMFTVILPCRADEAEQRVAA